MPLKLTLCTAVMWRTGRERVPKFSQRPD